MKISFLLLWALLFQLNANAEPAKFRNVQDYQAIDYCSGQLAYLSSEPGIPWEKQIQDRWGYSKEDFKATPEALAKIRSLNSALLAGHFASIRDQILDLSQQSVPVISDGQPVPLHKVFLPALKTGLYMQNKPLDPNSHRAIVMFLPGAGTNFSVALGMKGSAFAISKVQGFKPEWGDSLDKKSNQKTVGFRGYGVLFDPPGNAGLGAQAEANSLDPEFTMLAIQQAALIMHEMYGLPVFLVGRSQGGLQAVAAANRFGRESGIYGAVAINPTPTLDDDVIKMILFHENHQDITLGSLLGKDNEIGFYPSVWASNALISQKFGPYIMDPNPKTTSLILYGSNDPSYEPFGYLNWLKSISQLQVGHEVEVVDHPYASHDLLNQNHKEDVFNPVLKRMVQYMRQQLGDASTTP